LLLISVNDAFSQDATKTAVHAMEKDGHVLDSEEKKLTKREIDFYQSDNITNEIPYFDNRFQIDAELDEITLIFFRVRGSKPIILVQPDGKKIRVSEHDPEMVKWHDDKTFDMVQINKPMPGPWQAIGNILPESKILIVSEVKIEIEPFPNVLLSGETIKVVGKLYNGNRNIEASEFKEVIELDVNFFSTNNSAYANFGADALKVSSFSDNGRGLDEYAGDNIYTGEFTLDFAPGEWQPVFVIKLPLMTRELRYDPVILHKSPVEVSVVPAENEAMPHRLILTIDSTYVDPSSLVFQGKITSPDRHTRPLSIIDDEGIENPTIRTKEFPYTEPGIHRVALSAFGRTVNGREFRLVVPEFSFNIKEFTNEPIQTPKDNSLLEQQIELADKMAQQQKLDEEKNRNTILIVAIANLGIILFAVALFFFMRNRKVKK
jgi:uncharacterized protein (TIGR03503 family)